MRLLLTDVNSLLHLFLPSLTYRRMDIQAALAVAGSKAALARKLGVSRPAVSRWVKAGKLPAMRVWQWKALEAVTPQITADSTPTPG
jgi:DNA invertase Pin-like site-specific DNA recombinase